LASIEARNDIEYDSTTAAIWSVLVPLQENEAQAALTSFISGKGLPEVSKPYLSAVTKTSVTLSGP
jgi:naphtho-gamma-pyrone polyketide synthase